MAFYICELKTEYALEEDIVALLNDSGAVGTSVEGAPLIRDSIQEGNAEIWDEEQLHPADATITVKGYFADDETYAENKQKTIAALSLYEIVNDRVIAPCFYFLADEEWQDQWKQYYKPFSVGKHFVIKPTWEPYAPKEGDLVIELDPGLAFGSGSHPTTGGALCLLEKYQKPGMRVLDCGSGSGILSVAAAYLDAEKVFAVDIDHDAILATVKNVRINHLLTKVEVFCADVTTRRLNHLAPFQLVVANIVADVIIPLLPHVAPLMAPEGILIAGGIIEHRKDEVFSALGQHGFTITEVLTSGDWITLAARKE